jgi:uncharacterized protein involved in exopolysaccharide biosynthesis
MNLKRILGLCIIALGLTLCGEGLWVLSGPIEYYRATVKIKIESDTTSDVPTNGSHDISYDPYFFETELEVIGGDIVLSNVVEALDLNSTLGKRYGRTLETAETILLLRERMNLQVLRNTKIVEIRVSDEDPKEAARMANGIAKAYLDYRVAQRKRLMANGVEMLDEDLRREETKVLLMQSNLDQLREQLHISDTNNLNNVYSPLINNETVQHLKELSIEDEANYKILKNELAKLQSIQATNPAALRDVLPTMCSDDMLAGLQAELDSNKRKLASEANGAGGVSSDRAAIQTSIADLNKKIDARVNGIMMTLETRVDGAKTELDTLNTRLKELEPTALPAPYWEAKWNLESEKRTYELLKAKIQAFKNEDMAISQKFIPVAVIDPAVLPTAPSGPNRKLGAVLLVCGLTMAGFGFNSIRSAGTKEENVVKPV